MTDRNGSGGFDGLGVDDLLAAGDTFVTEGGTKIVRLPEGREVRRRMDAAAELAEYDDPDRVVISARIDCADDLFKVVQQVPPGLGYDLVDELERQGMRASWARGARRILARRETKEGTEQ